MVFGGIEKNSAIDYPGQLAAVVFTSGCNFRCPYCHNPDLIRAVPGIMEEKEVWDLLVERVDFLDAVVVTGGEPTLNPDLCDFLADLKTMGFNVKLDTNGSRPDVLKTILDCELADFVAMDVKTLPSLYGSFVNATCSPRDIVKSTEMIIRSGVDHEFRTTCLWPLVDKDIVLRLCSLLAGAARWVFQACTSHRVLSPNFFDQARALSSTELTRFATIAKSWVGEAVVRA